MATRTFLCGSSKSIHGAPAPARPDREPTRLRTKLHVPWVKPVALEFRVVAELVEGGSALVCLGATRDEVLAQVRALANELPAQTVDLRLEQWVGGSARGRWRKMSCSRRELFPPQRRQRRPRWR